MGQHINLDRQRLAALLGMLGSDHAGERDNAARAAHKLARSSGLTWGEILAAPERAPEPAAAKPAPEPPPAAPSPWAMPWKAPKPPVREWFSIGERVAVAVLAVPTALVTLCWFFS